MSACSSASHCIKIPINSRSEIDNVPVGFVGDMSIAWISVGHSTNQTKGAKGFVPANHTPPTPYLDASTKPLYAFVSRLVNSLT